LDDNQEWRTANPRRSALRHIVTVDQNLSFQQNLNSFSIAVIVLQAKTNRLADLKPLIPTLLAAIKSASPGSAEHVGA
jgi:hypothetical protein